MYKEIGKHLLDLTIPNHMTVTTPVGDAEYDITQRGGVTRTVETVNEVLSNGKKQQKQVITETSRQMVGGVLKDVKTITEIAADGTKTVKQTMETVRETAKTVTSTFDTLVNGVKTTTHRQVVLLLSQRYRMHLPTQMERIMEQERDSPEHLR